MSLSDRESRELLKLIGLTEETEINCERCLALVAEFAEHEHDGKQKRDALDVVQQHLSICGECQEEYEALRRTLE